MGMISRLYNSISGFRQKIINTLVIGIFGTATSIAIAIPLDKVDYNIVISEDSYPLLFAKKNKYGFSEKISQTELNSLDTCNSSVTCSTEAIQKGASKYLMSSAGGLGLATGYYNSQGKLVGIHLGGLESDADVTKPVITINGANPLNLQKGSSYTELGATAQDETDGSIAATSSGIVEVNTVGTYIIRYTAIDAAGNQSTKDRTVNVTEDDDITAPVITISGANPLTLQKGSSYTYGYATAQDDVDGSLTVNNRGTVNTNAIGIYTVTYRAIDAAGNQSFKDHVVNIVNQTSTDNTPPVITISGANPLTLQKGSSYTYGYATAQDDVDGSLTVNNSGTVNTNVVGTYIVTYRATDAAGNVGSKDHTVNIVNQTSNTGNTTPPTIPVAKKLNAVDGNSFIDSTADPVGYLDGEFSVSPSGAATYNIPIAIPPGTAGVQPNISLSYNSQSGLGIAGQGWSLSGLSSISRCPKTRASDFVTDGVEMDSEDVYCLDGQKLIKTFENLNANETFPLRKFKTEIDNYSEIVLIKRTGGNYFRITTKAGEIHTYGFTDDSAIYLDYLPFVPNAQRRISFLLNQTKDLLGNYINYSYANGNAFKGKIQKIEYTGNQARNLTPYHSINFSYGEPTQRYEGYIAGSNRYILQRLNKISVRYNNNQTIREYRLNYLNVNNDVTKVDKLGSIEECVGSKCLSATVFKWDGYHESRNAQANAPFSTTKSLPRSYAPELFASVLSDKGSKSFTRTNSTSNTDFYSSNSIRKFLGDVDGDGLTDIITVDYSPSSPGCNSSLVCIQLEKSNGRQFHSIQTTIGSSESNGTPSTSPFFLADVDGDGLSDLVNFNRFGKIIVYKSNGTRFSNAQIWRTSPNNFPTEYNLNNSPIFIQDMNGDGRADIVNFWQDGVYVSTSSGSSFYTARKTLSYFGFSRGSYPQNYSNQNVSAELIDVTANGLTDIVIHNASGTMVALNTTTTNITEFEVQLDTQTGNPVVAGHPNLNTTTNRNTPKLMGDVNSDGYPDIVGFFENGIQIAYGIGKNESKRLFTNYQFKVNAWTTNSGWNYTDKPLYVVDVNADGRADIIALDNNGIYVRLANTYNFDAPTLWSTNTYNESNNWDNNNSVRSLGDFNGDGLVDFIGIKGRLSSVLLNQAKQNRISQIIVGGEVANTSSTGMDRSIDIEYEKITAPLETSVYTKSTNTEAVQAPMFVVSAHFSSNGNSYSAAGARNRKVGMLYQYEGLVFDRLNGRGSLGFKKRITKDLSKNIYTEATFHQTYPLTGKLQKVETFLKTGSTSKVLNRKTITTLSKETASPLLNGTSYYRVYTSNEDENIYDLVTSSRYQRNLSTFSQPNSCGIVTTTKVTNYDLLNSENYSKETTGSYPSSTSCYQQSRVASIYVLTQRNGSESESRNSSFTYNSNGQILSETIEPQNTTKKIKTSYTYDGFGNVLTTSIIGRDIATRRITTVYDSKGRFATSSTNALNQTSYKQYDQRLGVVTSVTDINSLTTRMYYNDFAQNYLTVAPNNSYVHKIYNWESTQIGNSYARYSVESKTSEDESVIKYYDQLDRVIRTSTKGLNGNRSLVDRQFNLQTGELEKESLPYFAGGSVNWTTYLYDDLGRTTFVTKPGQTSARMTYYGLQITATDQQSTRKIQLNNVLGKPKEVTDDLGNKIKYFYYSDGSLKRTVNNAFGNGQDSANSSTIVTSFEYDDFGNKTKMIDPDMGEWNYSYYSTGELKTQTDAKGQTQTLFYDKLGRLITRSETDGTTTWNYDTAIGKSKGKLATVNYKGRITAFSYNSLGQLALEAKQISNSTNVSEGYKTYYTQNIYDGNGRIDTIKYPKVTNNSSASEAVKYIYGAGGKLTTIKDASNNIKYWEAIKADAFGNIKEESYGSNVKTFKSYDTLGRVNTILSRKSNNANIQYLDLDFDQVGNIIKRQNYLSQASETFNYDDLYRLKTTFTTYQNATYGEALNYDGHGNITSKEGKAYKYFDNSKHAVSNIGNDSYTYDANGNMESGAGRTIVWNSFNKPVNISRGTKSIQLLYDSDRNRVYKETTDNATNGINKKTWYVNGLFEREQITSGNNIGAETHKYYIKAGNQTIGYITHNISNTGGLTAIKTKYLLKDHLGSVDVIAESNGNIAQTLSFDSWGNRRDGDWNPSSSLSNILIGINAQAMKMGFTGHEHDDEVGLINMKGRLYDPEIGRFISADAYVQAPTDTQSYNRYTYVKNNPLSYTDPSGHFFWFLAAAAVAITAIAKPEYLRSVVAVIATIASGGWAAGLYEGVFGSIVGGAVGGFVGGAISTGSLSGALRGAAFGALSAGLTGGIANGIDDGIGRAFVHGIAQGSANALRGGKFGAGFVSGFASHVAAPLLRGANKYINTAKAAILGGTVSALVGGKFANGAISGAFVHLYNAEKTNELIEKRKLIVDKINNISKRMSELPQDVRDILNNPRTIIKYRHIDPYGGGENGWNYGDGRIFIQASAFEGGMSKVLDTFFHEIQHSRATFNDHPFTGNSFEQQLNDIMDPAYLRFSDAYQPLINIYKSNSYKYE